MHCGGEEKRTTSAQIGGQTEYRPGAVLPCLRLPVVCLSRAEVSSSIRLPLPLSTHFPRSSVILSSAARVCPSGPPLVYPSFLNI